MVKLAIFASGAGTNAENIIRFFKGNPKIRPSLVVSSNARAGVIQRAERLGVEVLVRANSDWKDVDSNLKLLRERQIDFIVLAGFLKLIPPKIIQRYPSGIVNIHPALLPQYGGKGMYGRHVHEAVIKNGESESGITIHLVNEKYDEGQIIAQKKVAVSKQDTPETLAQKIHQLEHEWYPRVILNYITKTICP